LGALSKKDISFLKFFPSFHNPQVTRDWDIFKQIFEASPKNGTILQIFTAI